MFAEDIMTPNVITVGPDEPLASIAKLLIEKRISAVPVVNNDNDVIGIVSEGDLVHRIRGDHELPRSWWAGLIGYPSGQPREYVKSHGSTAADVMTKNVITVTEFTSIAGIAEILESMHIKRVPVVRAGKLVGIVSRANIIQALVATGKEGISNIAHSDQEIRKRLLDECGKHHWSSAATVDIVVNDGVVQIGGYVKSADAKDALRIAAENIPGVKAVKENLGVAAAVSHYL